MSWFGAWPFAALGVAAALSATADSGIQGFAWAFARPPGSTVAKPDKPPRRGLTVPASNKRYDEDQLGDLFAAVDWFPASHPTPPRPVLIGRQPDAMACGFCHGPDGQGRPENAALAGLPAAYIIAQVESFRAGDRSGADPSWRPSQLMHRVASAVTESEIQETGAYLSRLRYVKNFSPHRNARYPGRAAAARPLRPSTGR